MKSSRVAFTDFSRHWMRSLKIKRCNYILLAAVNLSLKQIILLVWGFFLSIAHSARKKSTALGLEACKKPKKPQRVAIPLKRHLKYLPGSFRVGESLIFGAIFELKKPQEK